MYSTHTHISDAYRYCAAIQRNGNAIHERFSGRASLNVTRQYMYIASTYSSRVKDRPAATNSKYTGLYKRKYLTYMIHLNSNLSYMQYMVRERETFSHDVIFSIYSLVAGRAAGAGAALLVTCMQTFYF